MSGAVDRMRARKRERLLGVAMPSLTASADRMPAYAPTLSTPSMPGYARSLSDSSPTPSNFQLRAPTMDFSSPQAMNLSMNIQQPPEQKKENFFMRDAFGGFKWWQVMLGSAGALAVGFGIYKVATGSPSRVLRSAR